MSLVDVQALITLLAFSVGLLRLQDVEVGSASH